MVSNRYLYTHVHSGIIHHSQKKKANQVSMDKQNVLYTIYYLVLKRKQTLTHATAKMSLEDSVLSEMSQAQKDWYCMIPLIWGTLSIKSIETKNRWWFSESGEKYYRLIVRWLQNSSLGRWRTFWARTVVTAQQCKCT